MKKADFWKSDWFFGVVVSVVVLVLGNGELLQGLERKAYDMGVAAASRTPSDKVAVIAIDKASLDNIGRWPWSREIMADMVDKLAAAKAKVIATTVFYSEPQRDQGLGYINKLIETCGVTLPSVVAVAAPSAAPVPGAAAIPPGATTAGAATPAPAPIEVAPPPAPTPSSCPQIESILLEADQKLNTDRRLADAFAKAGNVALPMLFVLGEPRGRPDKDLPDLPPRELLIPLVADLDVDIRHGLSRKLVQPVAEAVPFPGQRKIKLLQGHKPGQLCRAVPAPEHRYPEPFDEEPRSGDNEHPDPMLCLLGNDRLLQRVDSRRRVQDQNGRPVATDLLP